MDNTQFATSLTQIQDNNVKHRINSMYNNLIRNNKSKQNYQSFIVWMISMIILLSSWMCPMALTGRRTVSISTTSVICTRFVR